MYMSEPQTDGNRNAMLPDQTKSEGEAVGVAERQIATVLNGIVKKGACRPC